MTDKESLLELRSKANKILSCSVLLLFGICIALAAILAYQMSQNSSSVDETYIGSKHVAIISDLHLDVNQTDTSCITVTGEWVDHYKTEYSVRGCDPSRALVNMTIQSFNAKIEESHNVPFVLVLGDMVGHYVEGYKGKIDTIIEVSKQFYDVIKTIPVFLTIGNNDVPVDYVIPDKESGYYQAVWENFYPLIKRAGVEMMDANVTFLEGGYYRAKFDSLYIVSLHTNVFSALCDVNSSIPFQQLAWLNSTLAEAKTEGVNVIIIGHIPSGLSLYNMDKLKDGQNVTAMAWKDKYTKMYNEIYCQYTDIISASFFGHHHADSWYVTKHGEDCLVSSFNMPSVSQIFQGNPSYTFSVVDSNWRVLDLIYYYCPVDFFSRLGQVPLYFRGYNLKTQLLQDLANKWSPITAQVMLDLANKVLELSDTTFNKRQVDSYQHNFIAAVSPYKMYCQITAVTVEEMNKCLRKFNYL